MDIEKMKIVAARPPKHMDLFASYKEAADTYEKLTKDDHLMSVTWANIRWLYMDFKPTETRLEYLKRCNRERILKADGIKEIKRIEKAMKKNVNKE